MTQTTIGLDLENISTDFVGRLPAAPDFMGFGGIAAGKRQMLAGLALTAAKLSPQPGLNTSPSTLQDIAQQGEPGGWGIGATAVDTVEPRRFNYASKEDQSQIDDIPQIETINYAPEYNDQIVENVVTNEYTEIDSAILRHLCCWMKNCNTILVILDSQRFKSEEEILDCENFDLFLKKLQHKNIIPVFTKTDVFEDEFIGSTHSHPRVDQTRFQEFVHEQFRSTYDVYRTVLDHSEHEMGYPIYIETKTRNSELVPKIPIQTYGFERLLDLLSAVDNTTTSVPNEATTLERNVQEGERLFQEAIARYSSGEIEITVARSKFKQAHEAFNDGVTLLKQHDQPHQFFPCEIEIDDPTPIDATRVDEISVLQPEIRDIISEDDPTMISDIRSNSWFTIPFAPFTKNESEIDQGLREALILLSWWHGCESITFPTKRAINRRVKQAQWGHENATHN